MMLPKIFAEKIYYYEEAIPNSNELVSALELSDELLMDSDVIEPWHDWVASGTGETYKFGYQKFTNESKLNSSSKIASEIYLTLKNSLTMAGRDYASKFKIEYIDPAPISVSKYQTGADMGPHVDYHGELNLQPLMSAVAYLNDDYEGGELYFPKQNIQIKPRAGSIVVFPSVEPFYHQSMPIISGYKYMSPAFWIKRAETS